jgi:hypothetical protein
MTYVQRAQLPAQLVTLATSPISAVAPAAVPATATAATAAVASTAATTTAVAAATTTTPTIATATAVATTATTAARTVTASTPAAAVPATPAAGRLGTSLIDVQRPTGKLLPVEGGLRRIGFSVRGHFYEAEALTLAGGHIHDDVATGNRAVLGKKLLQLRTGYAVAEIAHEKLFAHWMRTP